MKSITHPFNTFKSKIIAIVIILTITSCQDFIEIDPPRTSLTTAAVFANEETATAATRESMNSYQKKIDTYKHELTLDFKEKSVIKDLKHQIEQLTVKLEKAFSVKEELQLSTADESSSDNEKPKGKRKQKIRI